MMHGMRFARAMAALLAVPLVAAADTCTVGSPGLAFGPYTPLSGAAVLGMGSIVVSCGSPGTRAQVSLSAGRSGNANNRVMASPAGDTLAYQLYVDAARTNPWTTDVVRSARMGADLKDTVYVYGALFANQDAAPGTYTDTMTITINF
jgi:spore coat protein U-like protein